MFGHVWLQHHKGNPGAEYTCPVCDEIFKNYRAYTYHVYDVHEGHSEQAELEQGEDTRFKKRNYMYSHEKYLNKKLCEEKETLEWEFEGEFQAGEEVELDDFARCSTRIEMRQKRTGNPTMVGSGNVEFLSLPYKIRKRKERKGKKDQGEGSKTKTEKSKKPGSPSKSKSKAKAKNVVLNK